MILGNIDQLSFNPYRSLGHFSVQSNYRPSAWYAMYLPDSTSASIIKKASIPTGTQPSYSWLLAPKGGELSSTTQISGAGSLTAGQSNGINILADLDGSGTISDAAMALVTSMIASLSGSGVLTGSMVGTIQMASALAGSGSLTASMAALVGLIADLTGTGAMTSDLRGKLSMAANIYVNEGTAEANSIAAAVWSAIAVDNDVSGTMGEKLNAAGTAGDPWTTDLTGYNTAGTAGKKLKDNLTQNNFIALK
jgi:hypothetical protein